MEIRELDKELFQGKKLLFQYETEGYYDLEMKDLSFQWVYKTFDKKQKKQFEDVLLNEWLEDPILYGAFENDQFIGLIEGTIESWNNRFRISNILVFNGFRHQAVGSLLIHKMIQVAKEKHARMVVLETQSCNIPAIRCYQKCGFQFIGFDSYCYSNHDIENHEVRLEMGLVFD